MNNESLYHKYYLQEEGYYFIYTKDGDDRSKKYATLYNRYGEGISKVVVTDGDIDLDLEHSWVIVHFDLEAMLDGLTKKTYSLKSTRKPQKKYRRNLSNQPK